MEGNTYRGCGWDIKCGIGYGVGDISKVWDDDTKGWDIKDVGWDTLGV